MEYTLAHHGIKGQKWGVRRFRNTDGSLTPAGRKRAADADAKRRREEQRSIPKNERASQTTLGKRLNAEGVERTQSMKNVADSGKQMTDALRKMNSDSMKRSKSKPMDLSKMSDQEMRDRINRALLEKQYNDMFDPPTVSRGRQRVDYALETAGNVMAVAGSALAIAVSIQKLRGAI